VRVADFGVASAVGLDSLTQTGTVIGTAGYLSPEQAQGKSATPASDRYALAIVAFELLSGERPFRNDNSTAEAAAHVHAPIPALSRRTHGVPPQVDRVFERALAKDPDERYSSCTQFVSALRAAFSDAEGTTRIIAPPPPTPATRTQTHAHRRRRIAPLALGLLAIAGAAIAAVVVGTHRGSSPAAGRVTVTRQGTTVVQTVTAAQRPTTSQSPPPASSGGNAQSLALQGYEKLRAGDYAGAFPQLEQAAQQLQGSGTTDEAYNDYNLAYALAKTSGCSAQVLRLLDASQAIQGRRAEIDRLRASCR
jgi:serine/threonine-protein kinase